MLAEYVKCIAQNSSEHGQVKTHSYSPSFVHFVHERAVTMASRGCMGMAMSMNHSWWGIDEVRDSLKLLRQDGFDARLEQILVPMENGQEEGIEYIIKIEWK